MEKITSATELRSAILLLETNQANEGMLLKQEFYLATESFKPINLIKSTFKDVATSEELKDTLINTSAGMAAGYLSKKIFEGVTSTPLRKLLGTALQYGITSLVANNPETVKAMGKGLLDLIRSKAAKKVNEAANNPHL